jgi:hypothetical protein
LDNVEGDVYLHLLRLLHHAVRTHLREWHGSHRPTVPLSEVINAADLVGEILGEQKINRKKAREETRRAQHQRRYGTDYGDGPGSGEAAS